MSTAAAVWVDGEPASGGLLEDRGLHYGDGLFETIVIREGRPRFAGLHEERLARGAAVLGIAIDAAALISAHAARLAGEGVLKLVVTRGDLVQRGYGVTGRERPRTIAWWFPGSTAPPAHACTARLLEARWGENPALAGLKHLNRLEQVLARRELGGAGAADEGVVRSSSGAVCSGTMSNLFVLHGTELRTPAVDRCGIAGVMRQVVLREAPSLGLTVREATIDSAELDSAEALFFTNVRLGVWPVTRYQGRELPASPRVARLRDHLASLHE